MVIEIKNPDNGSLLKKDELMEFYHNHSNLYDLLFKPFFQPRQKKAIGYHDFMPGERILDVGVGTGLSLDLYPSFCEVIGIDLSKSMLRLAERKVEKLGLTNVTLYEMDACNLKFDENSFDYVVATHIVNVVHEPARVIDEMRRVAKPSGSLVIVNHFVSSNPIMAKVENLLEPVFQKVGWRLNHTYEDFIHLTNLSVMHIDKLNKIDLWKIIHASNNKGHC